MHASQDARQTFSLVPVQIQDWAAVKQKAMHADIIDGLEKQLQCRDDKLSAIQLQLASMTEYCRRREAEHAETIRTAIRTQACTY